MKYTRTEGKVTNIEDPAEAGRIKVALAEMDGNEYPEWLDPELPPGWHWLPEPGDTVAVLIPEGDDAVEFADHARWLGQVFDQDNPHPEELVTNYPKRRGFKTKAGHLLIVDDKEEEITLAHKGTLLVSLTNDGIFFGTQNASEPFVLGNLWKAMMDTILNDLATHTHPTGVGPSGPPLTASVYTGEAAKTADALSDFIFGQKAKP